MAVFVVSLGFTPADYWAMRTDERKAIINEVNKQNAKKRK